MAEIEIESESVDKQCKSSKSKPSKYKSNPKPNPAGLQDYELFLMDLWRELWKSLPESFKDVLAIEEATS
jgi:hypothetical protein